MLDSCEKCKSGTCGIHVINPTSTSVLSKISYTDRCTCSNLIKVDAQILKCNKCKKYYLADSTDHTEPDKIYNTVYSISKEYALKLAKEWKVIAESNSPNLKGNSTKDSKFTSEKAGPGITNYKSQDLKVVYSEILLKDKKGRILYECRACGLNYLDRKTAEECEKYCRTNNACKLEIRKKSVEV